jgi:hypothetical protein
MFAPALIVILSVFSLLMNASPVIVSDEALKRRFLWLRKELKAEDIGEIVEVSLSEEHPLKYRRRNSRNIFIRSRKGGWAFSDHSSDYEATRQSLRMFAEQKGVSALWLPSSLPDN